MPTEIFHQPPPAPDGAQRQTFTRSTNRELYQSKRCTLAECLDSIRSGEIIGCACSVSEPSTFLNHVEDFAFRVKDVMICKTRDNSYSYLRNPAVKGHVRTVAAFFDQNLREGRDLGLADYVPADLHMFGQLRMEYKPIDTFWAQVSPMDEDGCFCIPYGQMFEPEFKAAARRIVLEVNRNFRKIRGALTVHISEVDRLYEVDTPLVTIPQASVSQADERIGALIAQLIHDGDCIQLGWGGLPDVVAHKLRDKNDLGAHTEVFTSTLAKMVEAGVITGKHKTIDRGEHLAAFTMGDEHLYRVFAENPNCRLAPSHYINNPAVISQIDNMVSINTALEIDLTGQICSESIGPIHYSGTGGACDFACGALHSKGGRGIIAFQSTAKGGTISKIKATLTPGSAVSIPRNMADIVITEYGIARLRGRSIRERAQALIEIAHPDFRDQLRDEARQCRYI